MQAQSATKELEVNQVSRISMTQKTKSADVNVLEEEGRYVMDNQLSQVPKTTHLIELVTIEETNEDSSDSTHGLDSQKIDDSSGPIVMAHQNSQLINEEPNFRCQ